MKKVLWNDGWSFSEKPLGTSKEQVIGVNDGWHAVDVPHDWLIYDAKELYRDGEGWYRKKFSYTKSEERVFLHFDGVYMNCTVYLNGVQVFEWKYGYSAFEFDITDGLAEGENVLYVQVRHQSPNSRWYSGAGIYRNVWMITRPQLYLAGDGIYVHTVEKNGDFSVTVAAEAESGTVGSLAGVHVKHCVVSPEGETVAESNGVPLAGSKTTDKQEFVVTAPKRWDIESPVLYTLVTQLVKGGEVVDEVQQQIGFRSIAFDTEKGFFLNGRHVKLYGVCEHHDLGCLGAAFNKKALRRQFEKLRKMGVNALRTSHNMPAAEFMELADEMGFLVVAEAFDMWERSKTPYDYARFF